MTARHVRLCRTALAAAVLALGLAFGSRGGVLAGGSAPAVITNPVRVTIPALGVDANVQDVGLADDGSMGVPVGYEDVAFYTLGADPGQVGYYSVFTGHISSIYYPGVFYNIDELSKGNTIHIFGDDGTELVFIVQEVDTLDADTFPMDKVFGGSTTPGVALITCGGDWDPNAHLFSDRILVLATISDGS